MFFEEFLKFFVFSRMCGSTEREVHEVMIEPSSDFSKVQKGIFQILLFYVDRIVVYYDRITSQSG